MNKGKLVSLGEKKTTVDGKPVSYLLKQSTRAKSVRFQVLPGLGLTVVIPRNFKPDDVPGAIQKHARWVMDKLARATAPRPEKSEPVSGDTIPYLGRGLSLVVKQGPDDLYRFKLEPEGLVISLGSGKLKMSALLEHWYRRQAARIIKPKLDESCSRLGLSYNRLFIRGQRTRWGSCSKKGNLGFNWKLILTPEPVIEYVIIHELVHLQEMNHGKRFWALVAHHCPAWREHRKWLHENASLADRPLVRVPTPPR